MMMKMMYDEISATTTTKPRRSERHDKETMGDENYAHAGLGP